MNSIDVNLFSQISINGRFIYGYLCLNNAIKNSRSDELPFELEELCQEFVSTDKLDNWHTKVEDLLPSFLLDTVEIKGEFFHLDTIEKIKLYYQKQPLFIVNIIENLFWLGISNLYTSYRSDYSLKYLKIIIEKMNEYKLELPLFETIKNCSSSEKHGWGNPDNLRKYLA